MLNFICLKDNFQMRDRKALESSDGFSETSWKETVFV